MSRRAWLVFALGSALPLAGCRIAQHIPDRWQRPDLVVVRGAVALQAEHDAFRLEPGDVVRAPFWSFDCPGRATADNAALALRLGARRVRVEPEDGSPALHGVLALCQIHHSVEDDTRQMYEVVVPQSELTLARHRRAVVSATQDHRVGYRDGEREIPAWILWLGPSRF